MNLKQMKISIENNCKIMKICLTCCDRMSIIGITSFEDVKESE